MKEKQNHKHILKSVPIVKYPNKLIGYNFFCMDMDCNYEIDKSKNDNKK